MRLTNLAVTFLSLCVCTLGASCAADSPLPTTHPSAGYSVTRTFNLGGEGRWDYLTLDADGKLLYVTRQTHMMIINAATGAAVADVGPIGGAHGVALVPKLNRGFITDGKNGVVVIFDLKTHAILGQIPVAEDADGIIYDPATNKVLVVCGDAGALVPISPDVDPKTGKSDPPIDLSGKPEFFAADGHGQAFVTLNDKNEIAVVDLKAAKVLTRWSTAPGTKPTGLAFDPAAHRLFVGCRNQKLIVMNSETGHILADLPIGQGVDATVFANHQIFNSCGDGTLTIIIESAPDKFETAQIITTALGARTMALNPTTHTIYLPTADFQPAPPNQRPEIKPDSFKILVVSK